MDANELGRWTRFAAKGGIGKCTAIQDCVAEEPEDLMFLKVNILLEDLCHELPLTMDLRTMKSQSLCSYQDRMICIWYLYSIYHIRM